MHAAQRATELTVMLRDHERKKASLYLAYRSVIERKHTVVGSVCEEAADVGDKLVHLKESDRRDARALVSNWPHFSVGGAQAACW